MSLYIGVNKLIKLYLGGNEVKTAYLGNDKVYDDSAANLVVDYSLNTLTLNDIRNGKKTRLDGDTLWLL